MKQIICVSTSNYYPFPTRKQNVMNRLSDAEIIYIDPPVTYLAPLKDKAAKERLSAWKKDGVKAKENVTVYASPPVLPFFNKYRWINRMNQKRLAKFIKRIMRKHGFQQPYLWCYSPTSCDLTEAIPNRGVIYDCVDRHSAYKGMIDPKTVDRMEEDLARNADMVFCTAQGLYETLKEYNSNTAMIPNGAAYEIFSKAAESGEAQEKRKQPVFGFVGMLQDCIDYQCLRELALRFPNCKLQFIGKRMPGVDLSPIESCLNAEFIGLVPQPELPGYIRGFDVCLNVFQPGKLSKDVSPLKFYEYLATGKPIVSTKEPLQVMDFADVVYIADDREEFLELCGQALKENDPEKRARRMAYGKACSWDQRVKQMEQILEEKNIF